MPRRQFKDEIKTEEKVVKPKEMETGLPKVEVKKVKEVKTNSYKLLAGRHYVGSVLYEKNSIVKSSTNLVKQYGRSKFQLIK